MCDCIRGMDWWMALLTTGTHHSELQEITALPLMSTLYSSPQHSLNVFQSAVLTICSLATAANSADSSASCAQVLPSPTLVQNCLSAIPLTEVDRNFSASLAEHNCTQHSTISLCYLRLPTLNTPSRYLNQSSPQLSLSHIATDGLSVCLSWYRAPSGAHDQIFVTVWQFLFCPWGGALSDERVELAWSPLYIASRRTQQKTPISTIPLLLLAYSLPRESIYRAVA
jgi:hypothetical protein